MWASAAGQGEIGSAVWQSTAFSLVFVVTLSLSSALLFSVQPMVARMLLPLLGGAPAVWNTCLVFFQALLLGGYLYAHASLARLGPRRQAIVHAAVLLLPLIVLPIAIDGAGVRGLAGNPNPSLPLMLLLLGAVGAPFFVLSASAPLLQRWFSALPQPGAHDPYFLYAASNLGSMVGLLAYPTVLEPLLGLEQQSHLWQAGYVLCVAVAIGCAAVTWRAASIAPVKGARAASLPVRRRLRWIFLAALPSSLLLGTTTYITTDVAAVPLLWVPPLALYLGTFILVFARRPPVPHQLVLRALPFVLTLAAALLLADLFDPPWLIVAVHLLALGVVAMACHGELARDRPDPAHLTEYYLWLSVGGVVGGVLNALVAPVVFDRLVEYPLALVLAPLAVASRPQRGDVACAAFVGAAATALVLGARHVALATGVGFVVGFTGPLFGNYLLGAQRPARFALGFAAILAASAFYPGTLGETVYRSRNFFGVLRVARDPGGRFVQLVHGRIVHGRQSLEPERRGEPLAYYHPTGPAGDVFTALAQRMPAARVGVIGLGAGALARYAQPDQAWTFYEINPDVVRLARDPRLFTFLSDSFPAPDAYAVVLGDARLRLAEAAPRAYDLLVLDAFSSDTIPLHLLTREALRLYLEKLAPQGLIAVHISNRYLRLAPVLAALASDAGVVAAVRDDWNVSAELLAIGKTPSAWAAFARDEAGIDALARVNPGWRIIEPLPGAVPWTDDYANILSALAL